MRIFPTVVLLGALTVVAQSPSVVGDTVNTVVGVFTKDADGTDSDTTGTYEHICPLFATWSNADSTAREATAQTMKRIARKQAKRTDDPAARAFLRGFPAALGDGSEMQSRAARAVIKRECDSHRN